MEEITPHLNEMWSAASAFSEPLIGLMDTPQWGYSLFDAGSWAYSVSNRDMDAAVVASSVALHERGASISEAHATKEAERDGIYIHISPPHT